MLQKPEISGGPYEPLGSNAGFTFTLHEKVNELPESNFWGGSRGGSGGSVEPPKLNVKTYNKSVVKKKVNQLHNYCS